VNNGKANGTGGTPDEQNYFANYVEEQRAQRIAQHVVRLLRTDLQREAYASIGRWIVGKMLLLLGAVGLYAIAWLHGHGGLKWTSLF